MIWQIYFTGTYNGKYYYDLISSDGCRILDCVNDNKLPEDNIEILTEFVKRYIIKMARFEKTMLCI